MSNLIRFPRSEGGEWEAVRDSHSMIRYRRVGDMAWLVLQPTDVATLNAVHFGE